MRTMPYLGLFLLLSGVTFIHGCKKKGNSPKPIQSKKAPLSAQVEVMKNKVENNFIKSSLEAAKSFVKIVMKYSNKLAGANQLNVKNAMKHMYANVIENKMSFAEVHQRIVYLLKEYDQASNDIFEKNADVIVKVLDKGNRLTFSLMYVSLTQSGGVSLFKKNVLAKAKEEVDHFVESAVNEVANTWLPVQYTLEQLVKYDMHFKGDMPFKYESTQKLKDEFKEEAESAFMLPLKSAFCRTNKAFKAFAAKTRSKRSESVWSPRQLSFALYKHKLSDAIEHSLDTNKRVIKDEAEMLKRYIMKSGHDAVQTDQTE